MSELNFTLRPIRLEDAPGVHALRIMPGVLENILGVPSERLSDARQYIQSLDSTNSHVFVGVLSQDGEESILGVAGLHVMPRSRERHRGVVGIMVHRDYQGRGVGRSLMEKLLDVGDNWLNLVRIELTVFADNHRAIGLYEKCGFTVEGILRKWALKDGEYADNLMMARIKE